MPITFDKEKCRSARSIAGGPNRSGRSRQQRYDGLIYCGDPQRSRAVRKVEARGRRNDSVGSSHQFAERRLHLRSQKRRAGSNEQAKIVKARDSLALQRRGCRPMPSLRASPMSNIGIIQPLGWLRYSQRREPEFRRARVEGRNKRYAIYFRQKG